MLIHTHQDRIGSGACFSILFGSMEYLRECMMFIDSVWMNGMCVYIYYSGLEPRLHYFDSF